MPPVSRLGDTGSGHECYPPTPTIQGSSNVFVNNLNCCRQGDAVLLHACPDTPPHGRSISSGSSTVKVNSKPIARIGDSISCGGSLIQGSNNVIAGG